MKIKQIPLTGIVMTHQMNENAEMSIPVSDVLFPVGCSIPQKGISFLYGGKVASSKAFSLAYQHARQFGYSTVVHLPFDVELPSPETTVMTADELAEVKFIHIERVQRDVADKISPHFIDFMKQRGESHGSVSSVRSLAHEIGKNPMFIDYLHQQEEFKNIEVFAYPVIENDGSKGVRATLYNPELVRRTLHSPLYPNVSFFVDLSRFT